jgi:hypothetical protein
MTTEDLFELCQALRGAPHLVSELRNELRTLVNLTSYRDWQATLAQAQLFRIPPQTRVAALATTGLSVDGRLQVRVNIHASRLFLTDGVTQAARHRVFPYHDESATLREFVVNNDWLEAADVVFDLAGGCGHTAWSLDGRCQVLLDINPRALAYAELNRLLNELDSQRYVCALNDIRQGVPRAFVPRHAREVLVLANMPFSPTPSASALPLTTGGGSSGMDLQRATFDAIERLRADTPAATRIRCAVLGLTVGSRITGAWELCAEAVERFGPEHVRWHALPQEPAVRIGGVRSLSNPCNVRQALPAIAECSLFTPNRDHVASKKLAFEKLAAQHVAAGNPDLAYGFVTVEV